MVTRLAVVLYDRLWPQQFAVAAGEIAVAMGGDLLELHHIGSTSIPGMHAKPVIDMLAVVGDLAAVDRSAAKMEAIGYEVMGEFGIGGRRYFRRNDAGGVRAHQVHTFERGSVHVERHLAFRDFMRAHAPLASEYAALKRRLAEAHPHDMTAYMDGKDGFIKEMEARALAWVAAGQPRDTP
jgi:GrpB-like predicted nucleotidyltransferase (UPF0157 family)